MTQHRFGTLDGLRGVAAFAVVLYHFGTATGNPYLAPAGKLAVDFFFVLSGFVLAHAYGRRIANRQIGPLEFLRLRFLRLWPTALLGALLGLAVALGTSSGSAFRATPARDHRGFGPRAHAERPLELPWDVPAERTALVPIIRTRCELRLCDRCATPRRAGSLVRRRGNRWRSSVRDNAGLAQRSMAVSARRILVLRRRARVQILGATVSDRKPAHIASSRLSSRSFPFPGPCTSPPSSSHFLSVVFPAIVWLGASAHLPAGANRYAAAAGEMSYPLYAIHYPFVLLLSERPLRGNFAAMTIGAFAVTLLLSLVALGVSRLYDRPIRSLARRALVAP